MSRRALTGLFALALLAGLAGWLLAPDGRREVRAQAQQPCGRLDSSDGGVRLPRGLTLPESQRRLRMQTEGQASVLVASTAGAPEDIVRVRDTVLDHLRGAGFTVKGTVQQPGHEAAGEVAGPFTGTVRVRPLCAGRLEIRYQVQGKPQVTPRP